MRKFAVITSLVSLFSVKSISQGVAISGTNGQPHISAILDLQSTNKGFLPPRMSWSQIQAIPQAYKGLVVFDTDINKLRLHNGSQWTVLASEEKGLSDPPGSLLANSYLGGSGGIFVQKVIRDDNGNSFIGGYFTGTIGYGHINITAQMKDIFFAKYDKAGTLLWFKPMGGQGDDVVNDMEIDNAGNIYLAGSYQWIVDFNPHPDSTNSYGAAGGTNGFFAKYTNNGNYIIARAIGGQSPCDISSIAVDKSSGDMYFTGSFSGTGNFNYNNNPSTFITSAGLSDIYVMAVAANAQFKYVKRIGNVANNLPGDLLLHGSDLFLTGKVDETMDMDPGAGVFNLTESVQGNGFYARYDSLDGSFDYAYMITSPHSSSMGKLVSLNSSVIAVMGTFKNSVDLNPGAGNASLLATTNHPQQFVALYHATTGGYLDCRGFFGTDLVTLLDITADDNSMLFVTGSYYIDMPFQMLYEPGKSLVSTGFTDLFLCKLDGSLNGIWVQEFKGGGHETVLKVGVSNDGKGISMGVNSNSQLIKYAGGLVKPYGGFVFASYLE